MYALVKHIQKKEFTFGKILKIPFFNTHPNYLPYDQVQLYPHKKLFVVRNPLDKSISSFFYRIHYRATGNKLHQINEYLNEEIFDYCLENIEKFAEQIRIHIENASVIPNSYLFDYSKVIEDKSHFISKIADIMNVPWDKDVLEYISKKTDIRKCAEYESKHRSFQVGAIQNGPFFRRGANNDFERFLRPTQIDILRKKLPVDLRAFFEIS